MHFSLTFGYLDLQNEINQNIKRALTLFVFLAEFFGAPNFFRRAENFIRIFGAPKKNSSCPKNFRHAEKKFVAPKIFSACWKKIGRAENFFAITRKIRHDENFHENIGHAENFFGATNFYVRKLGMPKKFLSCRKWKGIISACPIFALYPGLALIPSTFNR